MGFQNEALDLFLTKSEKEAMEISDRLNEYNRERQDTEKKIFSEALQKIEKSEKDKPCIILGSENWHHGVIGIVASKVTDMYFKPSILICFEDGIGKGSGRSVPGFDLHEALSKCDKYVEKFGGQRLFSAKKYPCNGGTGLRRHHRSDVGGQRSGCCAWTGGKRSRRLCHAQGGARSQSV